VVASVKIEPKSKSAVLEIETVSSTTILEFMKYLCFDE
jgi:hypothetical protein